MKSQNVHFYDGSNNFCFLFRMVLQKPNLIISLHQHFSGCSVARLSRLLWEQEVAGSNPATPTNKSFLHCRRDFLFLIKPELARRLIENKKDLAVCKTAQRIWLSPYPQIQDHAVILPPRLTNPFCIAEGIFCF